MSSSFAVIPRNIISPDGNDGESLLKAMGVKFSTDLNEHLRRAELPRDLSIKVVHPRVHIIVDQKRRKRAIILIGDSHKDAPHIELLRRFCITLDCKKYANQDLIFAIVFDGVHQVHETGRIPLKGGATERGISASKCISLAEEWLDKFYPSWRSPAAYWD